MKHYVIIIALLLEACVLGAQQLPDTTKIGVTFDAAGHADTEVPNLWSSNESLHFNVDSTYFDLRAGLKMNDDGEFSPDIANFKNSKSFGDQYFLLEEGWIRLKALGASFTIGRIKPTDEVNSPYSLFLNPDALASNSMVLRWDSDIFSYETRWIDLNSNSNFGSVAGTPEAWQWVWNGTNYEQTGTGFPDRGLNLHNYVFKVAGLRFGFQESELYTQRSFDPEYFASPLPMYFTEYYGITHNRPQTSGGGDSYIMGLFGDYTDPNFYLYGQFLLQDFNLHALDPNIFPNNPYKMAWSLGGTVNTEVGKLGFYHAGATKYTFEPITSGPGQDQESAHGYFYYPDTTYITSGVTNPLKIGGFDEGQSNEIGYRNGENNISFLVSWEKAFFGKLGLASSLEFVVTGNSSPANPWQDAQGNNDVGTQILNQPVLEKRLLLTIAASYPVDIFDFFIGLTFGGIFNELGLQNPAGLPAAGPNGAPPAGWSAIDYYEQIFKPSSADHLVFEINFGARINLDIAKGLREASAAAKQAKDGAVQQ